MLSNHLTQFLRDERGSYTVWSLVWFLLYLGIGGLAVDMTDGYRNQTLLQSTADAAALAGVIALPNEDDAVTQALNYAADNMAKDYNGNVLTEQDVVIGTWDFDSETFESHTADPNAVFVTTRRAEQNGNPVFMNFLRVMALWGFDPWMDVVAEAVAVRGIHKCHNNGIIAGGRLDIKTHTRYHENICLIGQEGLWHRNTGNEFDSGVYAGVGCSADENKCVGPSDTVAFGNDEFKDAFNYDSGGNYIDPTYPANAALMDGYISALQTMGTYENFDAFAFDYNGGGIDYSGYNYLANDVGGVTYQAVTGTTLPDGAVTPIGETASGTFTIYDVDCGNASSMELPEGQYRNMAVITNCPLSFASGSTYDMKGTLIATTYTGDDHAIHASGQVDLGGGDCGEGGVELYALGDIHFAASGGVKNTRILSQGDIHFAANSNGPTGIHIEALGDVFMASGSKHGSDYGLCPNDFDNGAKVFSYSLVR